MNDYRIRRIDWMTFSLYLALVGLGWLTVYTVTYEEGQAINTASQFFSTIAGKQLIWVGICLVVTAILLIVDWKFWRTFAYLIYILSLILLVAVLFFGREINGATSWFRIGSFGFQPSEIAKFATCLVLAEFLSNYRTDVRSYRFLLIAGVIMIVPAILILQQPDAGSALTFASFLILLYREGLSSSIILLGGAAITLLLFSLAADTSIPVILGLLTLGSIALYTQFETKFYWLALGIITAIASFYFLNQDSWPFILVSNAIIFTTLAIVHMVGKKTRFVLLLVGVMVVGSALSFSTNYAFQNFLQAHQQERINMWLRPDKCDPSGALYNVIQSKMAIGAGGLQGKGLLQGTMTKLNYVPEQSTDFIFCTIGEEQGFIGSTAVVILFLLLLVRMVTLAERQRANFSRHYMYGVLGIIFFHVFVNIGMTMGLLPIIGIPLPFISKGGSSLLGFTIMIAVMLKLDSNRYYI